MNSAKSQVIFLLILSSFVLIFNIWSGSLASWDEAFYAIPSREILTTGDWLTLHQMGAPLFNKPPLYMWLTAIAYKLFGVSEFSTRIWSAIFGIGCVMLTYAFSTRLFGKRIALFSALMLLSTSHFIRYAKLGMLDVPLTFFILASLYAFWRAREKKGFFYISGLFFGLALMTKSAAGFLAPIIILMYCVFSGEFKLLLNFRLYLSFIIGLLIALPWHIYEYVLYGKKFINDYFIYHVVQRSAEALEGNVGKWNFYIRILINKFKPWGFLAFLSVPYGAWLSFKKDKRNLFVFIWVIAVFLVFSLVKTKLQWYIVPAYPALAISIAVLLGKIVPEKFTKIVPVVAVIVLIFHVPYSHIFEIDYTPDIKKLAEAYPKKDYPVVYVYQSGEGPATSFYFGAKCRNIEDIKKLEELVKSEDFVCVMDNATFKKLALPDNIFVFRQISSTDKMTLFESKKGQFK